MNRFEQGAPVVRTATIASLSAPRIKELPSPGSALCQKSATRSDSVHLYVVPGRVPREGNRALGDQRSLPVIAGACRLAVGLVEPLTDAGHVRPESQGLDHLEREAEPDQVAGQPVEVVGTELYGRAVFRR